MKPKQLLIVLVGGGILIGSVSVGAAAYTTAFDANGADSQPTTGQQLATVLEVTDEEVSSEIEAASLEETLERAANESERAEILADRAGELRERTDEIATVEENATSAFESGALSQTEYAQRLAVITASASTTADAFDRLEEHTQNISTLELRTAGYDRDANADSRDQLARLSDAGARALLEQFVAEQRGEFSVAVEDGLSIEVENEDGERSSEFEQDQPGNGTFQVNQSDALATARAQLGTDSDGEWQLRSVDRDESGYFEFEFTLFGSNATGEAEVSVDGETGGVFEFEEEIEQRESGSVEEIPLSLSVLDGTVEPGGNVTLAVTAAGDPVEEAVVELDDREVGVTDADGRIGLSLPEAEDVEIKAEQGDREGELELHLQSKSPSETENTEIREKLSVTGAVDNGTISVTMAYDGKGVSGVTVRANGDRVGTTDANGTLAFEAAVPDELKITLERGGFGAEVEFEAADTGALEVEDTEIERRDVDDNDDDQELSISVVSGDPAPGATVTLEVTDNSGTVSNAPVEMNGEIAGTTGTDGGVTVTLPADQEEVKFKIEADDKEGELEIEFEDAENEADEDSETDEDGDDENQEDNETEESEENEDDESQAGETEESDQEDETENTDDPEDETEESDREDDESQEEETENTDDQEDGQ